MADEGIAIPLPVAPAADSRGGRLYSGEVRPLSFGEAFALLLKSWRFVRPHRRLLWLKAALAIPSLAVFLVTPWPLKIIIDNVIDKHPLTGIAAALIQPFAGDDRRAILAVVIAFLAAAAILFGIAGDAPVPARTEAASQGLDQAGSANNDPNEGWSLWNGFFGFVEAWVTMVLTQRMNQGVRVAVYDSFIRSPLGLYGEQKIGDAVFRVMNDSSSIGAVFYRGVLAPAMAIAMFAMTFVVISLQFSNEPMIPVVGGLLFGLIAVGATLFGRLFRNQAQRMRERGSDIIAAFEERLANVSLIKAFGAEARERGAIETISWNSFRTTLRLMVLVLVVIAVLAPPVGLLLISEVYHLFLEVIAHRITLGDVVLLLSYGFMLWRPAVGLGSTWLQLQEPIAGLRRIHSVLDRLGEGTSPDLSARDCGDISTLEFRDVALTYGATAPVVSGISFRAASGQLLALTGPSGSGKTTVLSAIPRFYPPSAGQVLVNGIDSAALALDSLRTRVGFVFQQETLFSRSIADNIRYGRPDGSDEDVKEAARRAGAAEFIEHLPQGYATILGRRGARLSVGQKERIAIARALIRKPQVLILDEPAAALDALSAAALMSTLRALCRNRIVLLVAHRPEILAACDRVIFLEQGRPVASGSHRELTQTSKAYRDYLATADAPAVSSAGQLPPSFGGADGI